MTHDSELSYYKQFLRQEVEATTPRSKSGLYCCVKCDSGHNGKKATGALSISKDGLSFMCFSCGYHGDIYDIVALREKISNAEAIKYIKEKYGPAPTAAIMNSPRPSPGKNAAAPAPMSAQATEKPQDYTAEIAKYAAALKAGSKAYNYLTARGFTAETIKKYQIGYREQYGRAQVVIPYPAEEEGGPVPCYIARYLQEMNGYKYLKAPGAREPLYNARALYEGAPAVFIVESQICALSIEQAGGKAVALGSATNGPKLIKQLKHKPTAAAFIVALDNDKPGREAAEKITAQLEGLGYTCFNGTPVIMGDIQDPAAADYKKDPNEVLQKYGAEAFQALIQSYLDTITTEKAEAEEEAREERQTRTGAGMIDAFINTVQTEAYRPIPTGIKSIDEALNGGLYRQQLVLLGAAPGVGKTAMAQWIFEGIAQRGTDVIFINLEMAREQLLARSLSRIIGSTWGEKINATTILQGYKWTEEQRGKVYAAADIYKSTIAPHMTYNPDNLTANLDTIMAYIEKEAQQALKEGRRAPIVVIDYLQLISGQPREDEVQVIKRAVASLKGYAIKFDTLVTLIIAHNRESNKSGTISMYAGRDTSALEYSADLQLALTYTACLKRGGQQPKSAEELTAEDKRFITLKATKGRFGGEGSEVNLYFNGETMTYTETRPEQKPPTRRIL